MNPLTTVWPLLVTWVLAIGLFIVIHRILNVHPGGPAQSRRDRIFSAEMVALSILFCAFVLVEMDAVRRGERPQPFAQDSKDLLKAFAVSLGVYRVFCIGER